MHGRPVFSRGHSIVIYFDNSATTRVDDDVAAVAVQKMTQQFGNPSSLHFLGAQAYQDLNVARNQVAKMLGAKSACIYFTSGGTESNHLAVQGGARANSRVGKHVVTTAIEHASVLGACRALEKQGWQVDYVRPNLATGRIRAEDIVRAVTPQTALVSCMQVNSETGELLPLREIIRGVHEKNPDTRIHVDCVQGFGKIPFKLHEYDVDFVSASAHKIHGPKGVGALYVREGVPMQPLYPGGSQEGGLRPGTESVPLACAFGCAADKLLPEILENYGSVQRLQHYLMERLRQLPQIRLTMTENISPYILHFAIPGIPSHETVSYFSLEGIYLSAGSACSRGQPSHVVAAMNLPPDIRDSVIRLSFCKYNTIAEADAFLEKLQIWLGRHGHSV